jgi:DNA polymerase-4/DNA polymerase V
MDKELPAVCIRGFPKAIVHVDMDSFFASCEQQRDIKLRGKPVCIGLERGIATSMSIEAKKAGVTRGMGVNDIKKVCPECIILPSDYETFGLYSLRMFEIVKQYSDDVEEYSVDECFADISGMRRPLNMTYQEIVEAIKHDIDTKLGTICSVGLAPTKTLAKVASKWKKPNGITIIPGKKAQYFLKDIPVGKVWGIGAKSEQFLLSKGVKTALDFAYKRFEWIEENFTKPQIETWYELRGEAVKKLQTEAVDEYRNITKRKTFTPQSNDRKEVFSRLCKNVENACIKARRHNLVSSHISFSIMTQNFIHDGAEIKLARPVADPMKFIEVIKPHFEKMFNKKFYYRTTQFNLHNLTEDPMQLDMFGNSVIEVKQRDLYAVIDDINRKFGKHAVHLGSTDLAIKDGDHEGSRGKKAWRKLPENWLPGETNRKKVNIPYCGYVT